MGLYTKSLERKAVKKEEVIEVMKEQGGKLIAKLETAIRAGNVRKVIVRNSKGKKLATFRLTIGLVGIMCAPIVAAVASLIGLFNDCTVEIVKTERE